MKNPVVGIIMGSQSDLTVMSDAAKTLDDFGLPYEVRVISAHRTPHEMSNYAESAQKRGLKVIIAGAGGSAHLPGMTASHTHLPVIAVPVKATHHDHEALWSNIKMPSGIPLATMPENGATNAALLAIRIIGLANPDLDKKYKKFVRELHDTVVKTDQKITTDYEKRA